jgi:quinol monooxygenase YgiN
MLTYVKRSAPVPTWHRFSVASASVILTILRMKSSPLRIAETVQALRVLTRAVRAERGFITSQLCLEADDPNTIHYEERWQTLEDLDDQLKASRYTRLLALMESATEQPCLEFHFVSETRGLEYVAALRGER